MKFPGLLGKGGHAEQVAAAAGSPQEAALLAAGRDFGLGPTGDMVTQFSRIVAPISRHAQPCGTIFSDCASGVSGRATSEQNWRRQEEKGGWIRVSQ